MGCDIHGYVEVDKKHYDEDDSWWKSAGDIFPFVGRAYDSFGCLFGVRNYAQFDPVAADRGIPDNAGRTVKEEYESWGIDAHSASHLYYSEVQEIDWLETAENPDERYSILDENKEPTGSKFALGPGSGWTEVVQENREAIESGEPVPNEDCDMYIQRRELTRKEAMSDAWDWLLNDHMALLADRFGSENVRLVVWFDN